MKPIEKKVVINAPIGDVWNALTDPAKIEKWMLMPNNFKPELNQEFLFNAEMNGNHFDIECKVLEISKNEKLVYTWSAPIFNGVTKVSINLKGENKRTELTLTHSGFDDNQNEVIESHSMGWDLRFVEKLKEVVEKH